MVGEWKLWRSDSSTPPWSSRKCARVVQVLQITVVAVPDTWYWHRAELMRESKSLYIVVMYWNDQPAKNKGRAGNWKPHISLFRS